MQNDQKQTVGIPERYTERAWENTQDWKNALEYAEKSLDEPYADPDDDTRTLSRQFLRMIERYDSLLIFTAQALATQQRELLEWVEEIIKNMRVAENIGDIDKGLTAYDSSLLGNSIPNARNRTLDDVQAKLAQRRELGERENAK